MKGYGETRKRRKMEDEEYIRTDRQRKRWKLFFDPRAFKIIDKRMKLEKI